MLDNIFFLMKFKDSDIYIKREDLIPFSFGGNKVRIVKKAVSDMEDGGYDVLISYGSKSSNLNRAAAHFAASRGMACTVIFKEEEGQAKAGFVSFNERLVRESGARTVCCRPDKVRETVEAELSRERSKGHRPYYIFGDSTGRGHETVLMEAYTEVYGEIAAFEEERDIRFSNIFLASGTGLTQSALTAASILRGRSAGQSISGISIARSKEREIPIIKENIELYLESKGRGELPIPEIDFEDGYVLGGYGRREEPIRELCLDMMKKYGLPLDETYTGKAFYGMLGEIEKRRLHSPILFIHTGGLPLFYDMLQIKQ